MAAKGQWREAIHFLYWASIARLESRRLWPADRARTPREYLALLAGTDPRKTNLTALTRSFERTWYGGRAAAGLRLPCGAGAGRGAGGGSGMKLFASLDAKDRKLLIGCLVAVVVLAFVTAFFARNENSDNNPCPAPI